MRTTIGSVAAALWIFAHPVEVAAQAPPDGAALFEQAQFEEAQAWFEDVLAAPDVDAAAVATAHVYLAALALATGDEGGAVAHAAAAAALDPTAAAPPGSPVELEAMLRAAAANVPRGGLGIGVEGPECWERGAPVRVSAELSAAPQGLVSSLTLTCERGAATAVEERSPGATVEVLVPTEGMDGSRALACEAAALTAGGAPLRSADLRVPACTSRHGSEGRGRRQRMTPWGWVGVGGGAAVVVSLAIVLGVVLSRPDMADVGEAELREP